MIYIHALFRLHDKAELQLYSVNIKSKTCSFNSLIPPTTHPSYKLNLTVFTLLLDILFRCSYQSDWARLFPGLSSGETGVGGQALAQLCTLGTTIAISGVGGLLTGAIMRKLGAIQFR